MNCFKKTFYKKNQVQLLRIDTNTQETSSFSHLQSLLQIISSCDFFRQNSAGMVDHFPCSTIFRVRPFSVFDHFPCSTYLESTDFLGLILLSCKDLLLPVNINLTNIKNYCIQKCWNNIFATEKLLHSKIFKQHLFNRKIHSSKYC